MGPTGIYTNHLLLRIEDDSKAKDVCDFYIKNMHCFERFEPTRPEQFYTPAYHSYALMHEYRAYLNGNFVRYYIYKKDNPNEIIGALNLNLYFNNTEAYAEVGYKIDVDHQGNGYAKEACLAGFDMLAKHYNIHRVDARVHPDNAASVCIVKALGFNYNCFEPKSVNIMGQDTDIIRYTYRF